MHSLSIDLSWTKAVGLFLLGGLAKYAYDRVLKKIIEKLKNRQNLRKWAIRNQADARIRELYDELEIIQPGWRNSTFQFPSEGEVVISLERKFEANSDILRLKKTHEQEWSEKRLQNNTQVGVFEIDAYRLSEESEDHQLFIRAQEIKYFDFLASNRIYYSGESKEKDQLGPIGEISYITPISTFANSLSVGLSLFCEGGKSLVLCLRTSRPSMGGDYEANSLFNAVGETMNPRDRQSMLNGHPRLSPWLTAKRGLFEEVGINLDSTSSRCDQPVLHSFVWDRKILDYKFFGYVVTFLPDSEIRRSWESAPDRHECKGLEFIKVETTEQCVALVKRMKEKSGQWSREARLSTIRSLSLLGKLNAEQLEEICR